MTHARRMLNAMTGPSYGLRAAYLMALASYSYTRSWHGAEGPDGKPMDFGRWYAFVEAVKCGARFLFKPTDGDQQP